MAYERLRVRRERAGVSSARASARRVAAPLPSSTSPLGPGGVALLAALALLVSALGLSACGGSSRGPEATVDAYRSALAGEDYAAAYELMSASFRARHSREEFERMVGDNPAEAREVVAQLGGAREDLRVQASLRYGLGEELRLEQEDGSWRLASNPLTFYEQGTARDALRSFLRAYQLSRWDIMLRFIPTRYRERMNADTLRQQFEGEQRQEMLSLMRALEANIDAPITDKGDEARMPYGERHEVTFVREDGLWKILDFD